MRVVARRTLHLVIHQQSLVDTLSGEAAAIPGRRYRRVIDGEQRFGVANVIGQGIFQSAIRRSESRVVGEGDRMRGVKVWANLGARIDVVGRLISGQTTDGSV